MDYMKDMNFPDQFLHIAIELFVVVDPFAAMILFISYSGGVGEKERRRTINDATLVTFLILLFFALLGYYILLYFGISIAALEIAGGILILLTSLEMVTEGDKPLGRRKVGKEVDGPGDFGIVPLATPLLAGPGAISLVILLMHDYNKILVIIGIIAISVVTYLLFWSSNFIYSVIKEKGARALTRVFGILVAGFAVQYILTGVILFFHL